MRADALAALNDAPVTGVSAGMSPLDPGPVGSFIGTRLAADNDVAGDRPTADNTPLRGSEALHCSRQVAFRIIGLSPDIPLDGATLLVFRAGHIWHDQIIQPALVERYGAEIEVMATWMPHLGLSCWLDAAYLPATDDELVGRFTKVAVEIKSMASYGFDLATGTRTRLGESPGPKIEHVCQSALGAMAPNVAADASHIIYASKERGVLAEWIYGLDDPLPHLGGSTAREIGTAELTRMAGILGRIENGELPRPVVPGHGLVTNPPARDSKGQPWNCRYCAWQPTCARLGTDVVPLTSITVRNRTPRTETENR